MGVSAILNTDFCVCVWFVNKAAAVMDLSEFSKKILGLRLSFHAGSETERAAQELAVSFRSIIQRHRHKHMNYLLVKHITKNVSFKTRYSIPFMYSD